MYIADTWTCSVHSLHVFGNPCHTLKYSHIATTKTLNVVFNITIDSGGSREIEGAEILLAIIFIF